MLHTALSSPLPAQAKFLASAGCLICRKPAGFGAELPCHLPTLGSSLCKLVRASLSLVTLMMVLTGPGSLQTLFVLLGNGITVGCWLDLKALGLF